jgi:hypothetical protein
MGNPFYGPFFFFLDFTWTTFNKRGMISPPYNGVHYILGSNVFSWNFCSCNHPYEDIVKTIIVRRISPNMVMNHICDKKISHPSIFFVKNIEPNIK